MCSLDVTMSQHKASDIKLVTQPHSDWLAAIRNDSWLAHQVGGVANDIGVAATHMKGGGTICEQVQKETEHKLGL